MKLYKCYICGKKKTKENFGVDNKRYVGVSSRCKACKKGYEKEYRKKRNGYFKEYREKNKEKLRAKEKVRYAIKKGLMKIKPCEVCGGKAEAHHEDYSKPLDVLWLCHTHHMNVHKKI